MMANPTPPSLFGRHPAPMGGHMGPPRSQGRQTSSLGQRMSPYSTKHHQCGAGWGVGGRGGSGGRHDPNRVSGRVLGPLEVPTSNRSAIRPFCTPKPRPPGTPPTPFRHLLCTHVAYSRGAGGASAKPRSGMLAPAKYSYSEAIAGTGAHGGRIPREPPLPDTHPAAGPQTEPAY